MDVELPNGVVIQGVPEGTSKEEIMQKAIRSGMATEADFAPKQSLAQQKPQPDQASVEPPEEQKAWYESVPQFVAAKQLYDSAAKVLEGYGALASGESPLPAFGEAISKAPTTAMAELGASMGTGIAGQVAGGLAGIGSAVAGGDGGETVEDVSGALTYQPRSESALQSH